ncbi:uncharacterized protein LOC133194517 [Saccostrea echinata]|uniref:uncharacterized protein LOC133194517 n=1 Tax=Saccostrea echinata TaxID=191078 RepID=UPI002A82934B|nr:uncharacterized protein LOC133194517 [Saccostrea echinata]
MDSNERKPLKKKSQRGKAKHTEDKNPSLIKEGMVSNIHEPLPKKSRKRKARDVTEDENPSLNLETETPSSSKTDDLPPREKHSPSSISTYTSCSEPGDDTEVDSNVLKSSPSSEDKRNYPASRWGYKDLMYINIFYEKKPHTLDKFVKEVKDAFMKEKGFCPDISKVSDILKKELEEMLTFSYDMTEIKNIRKLDHKEKTAKKVKQEMKEIAERANMREMPILSDKKAFGPALEKFVQKAVIMVNSAIIDFVKETSSLTKRVLFGGEMEYSSGEKKQNTENSFKNYCELFGRIFFLLKGHIPKRIFRFHCKKVRNSPDLVYHFDSGMSSEELLFMVEVKKAPVTENVIDIRDLVGKSILGQFGAELFGQSLNSVFFPNSLGVLCMETKLIFAFLKISKKHSDSIYNGERRTEEDPGIIMYTEPFDMLKAEDRLKLAEFLLWLGIAQDSVKFELF